MSKNDEPDEHPKDNPLKADLAALDEQIKQLDKVVDDLSKTVHSWRDRPSASDGSYRAMEDEEWEHWRQFWLETELTDNPYKFFHLPRMRRVGILTVDEFYDLCDLLDKPETDDLAMLDLVAKVLRRESCEEIYLAVNAFATVTADGLESVVERAKLLAKATNGTVLPVAVVRDEPRAATVALAKELGVALAQKKRWTIIEESMYIRSEG